MEAIHLASPKFGTVLWTPPEEVAQAFDTLSEVERSQIVERIEGILQASATAFIAAIMFSPGGYQMLDLIGSAQVNALAEVMGRLEEAMK